MKEKKQDDLFIKQVKTALDQSADELDSDSTAYLAKIRKQALYNNQSDRPALWERICLPVAGLATACVLLLAVVLFLQPSPEVEYVSSIEDVDLLMSADKLDLYDELDFYAWLSEELGNAG